MYPTGGADPKLAFDVKTNVSRLVPSTTLHSVTWKIGPSIFEYAMGEEEATTMEWSAATAGNGSSIQADNNGSPVAGPNAPGEWGLFHVLDAAVYTSQGSSVLATWRFGTPRITVQLEISPKKSVHPFSAGFLRLPAPPGN
jgi:type VI secretion system protein ImpL